MKISDSLYNVLKYVALVVLPAVATFLSVVLSLWNICTPETITAIVGTVTAADTLLGALLKISTDNYNKNE